MHFSASSIRVLAVLFVPCVVAVSAQERSFRSDAVLPAFDVHASLLPGPSIEADYRVPVVFRQPAALKSSDGLNLDWLQSGAPPPKAAKTPPEKIKRASINPSMVGYIENAVVHSEIRIRFDAALHDDTPDRAEFFYAKCGCYRGLPTNNNAYDINSPGPGTGIPQYVNFQQLYLYGEYAIVPKVSVFTQLPFRWLQAKGALAPPVGFSSNGGISDMSFGVKFAPLMSSTHSLTFRFLINAPTGDARSGLGTNHVSIEPSLLYYQKLSGRMAVEAEIGDTHPLSSSAGVPTAGSNGFAGDVFYYGVGPSYRFIDDEKFRLAGVVELVAWNVRSGLATGRTNTYGVNIVNMKVGPRMAFGDHHSLYVGYGIALTSQTWYREIFRTEYRYSF